MKSLIGVFGIGLMGVCGAVEAPLDLSWESYAEVRDYVIGDETGENYLKVKWEETVFDGQVAGVKEDKPILLWLYFGGPLGNC